jgi:hypothetical protein
VLVAGQLLGFARYGETPEAVFLRMEILWWGSLGLCALGAVMSWRMFVRLEAIEGRGAEVRLPRWLRSWTGATSTAPAFTKRQPIWLLVTKELHLQQMAFVIAGLYLLGWLATTVVGDAGSDMSIPFSVLTFCHGGAIALLVGSHTSAEERRLGTLAWQTLLPMAASKQWAVKVATALGLALLLAIGLPWVLAHLNSVTDIDVPWQFSIVVIVLTAVTIYVSSLCTGGLWALLMSLPAIFGGVLLFRLVVFSLSGVIDRTVSSVARTVAFHGFGLSRGAQWLFITTLELSLLTGLVALLLRFALSNHRSTDRAASRVWMQVIWMAGCAAVALILLVAAAL